MNQALSKEFDRFQKRGTALEQAIVAAKLWERESSMWKLRFLSGRASSIGFALLFGAALGAWGALRYEQRTHARTLSAEAGLLYGDRATVRARSGAQ